MANSTVFFQSSATEDGKYTATIQVPGVTLPKTTSPIPNGTGGSIDLGGVSASWSTGPLPGSVTFTVISSGSVTTTTARSTVAGCTT